MVIAQHTCSMSRFTNARLSAAATVEEELGKTKVGLDIPSPYSLEDLALEALCSG
jgi:hypothetical protein